MGPVVLDDANSAYRRQGILTSYGMPGLVYDSSRRTLSAFTDRDFESQVAEHRARNDRVVKRDKRSARTVEKDDTWMRVLESAQLFRSVSYLAPDAGVWVNASDDLLKLLIYPKVSTSQMVTGELLIK